MAFNVSTNTFFDGVHNKEEPYLTLALAHPTTPGKIHASVIASALIAHIKGTKHVAMHYDLHTTSLVSLM